MDIKQIFNSKYGGLIFSLLSGCAYFIIILDFLLIANPKNGLIAFFFSPAIICGFGLILFKSIKQLLEKDEDKRANIIGIFHIVLILMSVVFLIATIKR